MVVDSKVIALPHHAFPSFVFLIMFASAKFTTEAFENQRKMELLESERLASELESLKSQLNPHFLFNSLNTIYGLAKRTDADTASAILKLSEILRYILYDCNVQFITVEKEIHFLNNFIDFIKLRTQHSLIKMEVIADASTQQIAPLIILPFIENAIKHGISKHMVDSWIDIKLKISGKSFYFECSNSNYNRKKLSDPILNTSGIGLKNVKRRLKLIYPNNHNLEIIDNVEEFRAILKIELT